MNMVKIECNPYTKQIKYYWMDNEEGEWRQLTSPESPFSKPKFTGTTLQNVAYEIVTELNKTYNPGNIGMEIYFDGTKEDMEDLKSIVERYFNECGIQVKMGETYLLSAVDVKKKIEEIFSDMNQLFKEYPDNEVTQAISKFSEAAAPTIPICVMGLYSAGKSAFINSLLGIELLPSASDPTTAKTFKISSGDKYEIRFEYGIGEKQNVVLSFDAEGGYDPSQSAELEIIEKLEDILKEETLEKKLYSALTIINGFDSKKNQGTPDSEKKYFVGDLIEITLPIHSPILPFDKYGFVIYDTPGSNSASNTDHTEVLKKAMEGQTNGLPIFVTTPDNMDGKDNNELIETIDKLGGALDKSNLMIVVNKSDEKDSDTLKKKKNDFEKLAICALQPAGVYFVSSVMGLGYKKKLSGEYQMQNVEFMGALIPVEVPVWIDRTYDDVFFKNMNSFQSVNSPKSLYIHNIIDNKWQHDSYCALALDDSMRGYRNSGIHCVEYAIAEFAEKYALYNKCRNASAFLSQAMEQLSAIVCGLENENKDRLESIKSSLNAQQQVLLGVLKAKCEELKKSFMAEFADEQNGFISQQVSSLESSILSEIVKIWEESKKEAKSKKANKRDIVTSKVNELLKSKIRDYSSVSTTRSRRFWERREKQFKDTITTIILESPILTSDQRELLKQEVLLLNLVPEFKAITSIKRTDITERIIFWVQLIPGVTRERFIDYYKEAITAINVQLSSQSTSSFDRLVKKIEMRFAFLIATHNPTIIALQKRCEECSDKIQLLENQKNEIKWKYSKIQELTDYRIISDTENM